MQQQIIAGQVAKRTQKDLENRIYGLESQLEKKKADRKSEEELERKVKQLEEEHMTEIKKLQEVKEKYAMKITQKEQT